MNARGATAYGRRVLRTAALCCVRPPRVAYGRRVLRTAAACCVLRTAAACCVRPPRVAYCVRPPRVAYGRLVLRTAAACCVRPPRVHRRCYSPSVPATRQNDPPRPAPPQDGPRLVHPPSVESGSPPRPVEIVRIAKRKNGSRGLKIGKNKKGAGPTLHLEKAKRVPGKPLGTEATTTAAARFSTMQRWCQSNSSRIVGTKRPSRPYANVRTVRCAKSAMVICRCCKPHGLTCASREPTPRRNGGG